jgi:hypothetical protein
VPACENPPFKSAFESASTASATATSATGDSGDQANLTPAGAANRFVEHPDRNQL